MSKQYNLSTTEDNGQSVTTSQTVTEHPEEILRLMKLAGLENAQVVAEDDSEFESTEANDKLDLDDYSKKSPESIAKQKKTIQPTLGDNPLEYSLDETEIQEALTKEFDKPEEVKEEKLDEFLPVIAAVPAVKAALNTPGGQNLKKAVNTTVVDPIKNKISSVKKSVGDTVSGALDKVANKISPSNKKLAGYNDKRVNKSKPATISMPAESKENEKLDEILPVIAGVAPTVAKAATKIAKTIANKTDPGTTGKGTTIAPTPTYGYKDDPEVSMGWAGNRQDKDQWTVASKLNRMKNKGDVHAESEEVKEELTAGQKKLPDALQKSILAKQGKKDETKEVEENLKEAEEQIKALKEDCSCGHGSSCDCGPDCGCGCNTVNEDDSENWAQERESERHTHVNGSRETEEIEDLIRPFWSKLPEKLQLDLEMHFDSLKGEFDEAQELGQSQERIKKLMNY